MSINTATTVFKSDEAKLLKYLERILISHILLVSRV
jgi:hypothetical protein